MAHACQSPDPETMRAAPGYRRVLWTVLAINAAMFLVEGASGLAAGSVALQADALDFLGDAATYAISLYVLARSARWRAGAALLKGAAMGAFGLWVIGAAVYNAFGGGVPSAGIMGSVGVLAFVANLLCALLLFRFRKGDANIRSVWICSRNDALGNLAVIAAASGVLATGTAWPDLGVALIMAALALGGAATIIRQALGELGAVRHA